MHSPLLTLTIALTLLLPACVIERIDAIIAEHGVTYALTTTGSDETNATTDTSTSTDTDPGSGAGDSSTSIGASGSMSAGETTDASSSSISTGEPAGPVCGDKLVEGEEECDDGNAQDDDGCRNDCTRRWTVFVTSPPFKQGNFNGIIGADYECRHRATKMFLPGGERYMAWVSTSEVQPADRLYHARGPYMLVNGLQVAANWDALTSGKLENPINVSEQSQTVEAVVWTGTDTHGLRLPNTQHCSDWTYNDSDQTGWLASSTANDAYWTHGIEHHCGAKGAIYCFEQP